MDGNLGIQEYNLKRGNTKEISNPTREGYTFIGWIQNLTDTPSLEYKIEKGTTGNLNIIAKYQANEYTIEFNKNSDTATGTMTNQTLSYDQEAKLTKNIYVKDGYTFDGWNTKSDGTGTSYADEDDVINLATTGSIILYAKWKENTIENPSITYHFGNIEFNGSNYLNTNINLFSSEYFNKTIQKYIDFDINLKIDSMTPNPGQSSNRNVVVTCMNEADKTHYTGFDFRYLTNSNYYEMATNSNRTNNVTSTSTKNKINYGLPSSYPWDINIKRVGTELYLNDILNMDYVNIANNFNIPLLFGAEYSDKSVIYRYFKGTLSNITTKIVYGNQSEITLPIPTLTDNEFSGWNTKEDGTGTTYTTINNLTENIDLYAIWSGMEIDGYDVTYNYGNVSFDGNNYLNTHIELFSDNLYKNNFEISTTIDNFTYLENENDSYNTIVSNMDESNTSIYPGFVYRNNGTNYYFNANSSTTSKINQQATNSSSIVISRNNRRLFFNNSLVLDFIDFTSTFDKPLLFGSSMDGQNQQYRRLKADLNNINVKVQYKKGTSVTLPEPINVNSTCIFTGWTGSNGTTPQKNVTISSDNTEDKQYTANFNCSMLSVTFDLEGGILTNTNKYYSQGESIGELPEPTKEGYTFDGWYTSLDDLTTKVDDTYTVNSDITLFAKWNINQYTITFDTDGGSSISPITLNYGATVTPPENPTKEDSVFDGWNPSIPETMPAQNITIQAKWIVNNVRNYLIKYNYGELTFNGQNTFDTKLELFSTTNYDKTNHVYKDFEINFKMDSLDTTTEDRGTLVQCSNESDSTNYPGFVYRYRTSGKKLNFTTYIRGSSGGGAIDFSEGSYPTNVKIKRVNNHVFINDTQATGDFDNIPANWNYPLTFGSALQKGVTPYRFFKGKISNVNVSLYYSNTNSITLGVPEFKNSECTFTGWTGSNGTTPELNVTIPSGNLEDKEYTANYDCSSSTITFNANGGKVTPSSVVISPGRAIGTLPVPTKEGYTFNGWYTSLVDAGIEVDENYVPEGDITLFAKWNINEYTITFNSNGGSEVSPITLEYQETITLPTNPTKTGYIFERWTPNLPEKMPANNITVEAMWKDENSSDYVITYDYGNITLDGTNTINTNLALFSNNLLYNDFSLSLNVENSEFVENQANNLNSVFSVMDEFGSPYPGLVFRRDDTKFIFVANSTSTTKYDSGNYTKNNIAIKRINNKLFLNENQVLDYTHLEKRFDSTLNIGSSLDKNNNLFRYFKGELNSVILKLKTNNSNSYTIVNPTLNNSDCTFTGWSGSNGDTPSLNITIPSGNTENKNYVANFECSSVTVYFNPNGGVVSERSRRINLNEAIGELPVPTKTGYIFDGWYKGLDNGVKIDENYKPTGRVTLYAIWKKTASSITVEDSELNVVIGDTKNIVFVDADTLGEEVTYTSNDETIATVDSDGKVRGLSEGETTITIRGVTSNLTQTINVYVSINPGIKMFNINNNAMKNYFRNVVSWNTDKESFLASMQDNFESNNCMLNSDSSIKYASGNVLCDKSLGYDTKVNGAVKVYLYDGTTNLTEEVFYTNSSTGIIYNMIPGKIYYWESVSDNTNHGYVKATGYRRA